MEGNFALIQFYIVNILLSELKAKRLLWLSKVYDFILRILITYEYCIAIYLIKQTYVNNAGNSNYIRNCFTVCNKNHYEKLTIL